MAPKTQSKMARLCGNQPVEDRLKFDFHTVARVRSMWNSLVIMRSRFQPASEQWSVRAKNALPIVSNDVVSTKTSCSSTPASINSAADAVASKTTEPRASSSWGQCAVPAERQRIFGFVAAARQTAAAAWQRAATNGNCLRGASRYAAAQTKIASNCCVLAASMLATTVPFGRRCE